MPPRWTVDDRSELLREEIAATLQLFANAGVGVEVLLDAPGWDSLAPQSGLKIPHACVAQLNDSILNPNISRKGIAHLGTIW